MSRNARKPPDGAGTIRSHCMGWTVWGAAFLYRGGGVGWGVGQSPQMLLLSWRFAVSLDFSPLMKTHQTCGVGPASLVRVRGGKRGCTSGHGVGCSRASRTGSTRRAMAAPVGTGGHELVIALQPRGGRPPLSSSQIGASSRARPLLKLHRHCTRHCTRQL